MTAFAVVLCIYQMALFWILVRGAYKFTKLEKECESSGVFPSLSIIVPARNEEETIEKGLSSLVQLDYPGLEIIVVNDRSTDGTLRKIQDLKEKHPQIKIKNIVELPSGWLGKNHALHEGAKLSTSALLLFTDADVEIQSDFLKQAVQLLQKQQLSHLGGIPQVVSRNWYLYPLVGVFGLGFTLFTRPWQGKDPKKDRAVGIGAFNLVRREAYESIEGHRTLCLRPDDDLKLALAFKRAGYKTDCVNGVKGMRVEWYPSFVSLMKGLEKNVMTGFEYDFLLAFVSLVLYAVTFILPFMLLMITHGHSFLWCLFSVCFLLMSFGGQLYLARLPLWGVPLMPLATPAILIIFIRACFLTFWRKGVFWRDTFYSLEALRANRMPLPGTLKKLNQANKEGLMNQIDGK